MDTYVINGVCRCCASQGSSKDIDTSYTWMGGEEIYSKMLRDCFDIALSRSVSGHDGGICELCVTQLRNAYNFKKQVVSTEEMLKKRLNSDQFKPSLVKVELEVHPERISDSDNDMGDHMDQDSGDDHSTKEFLVPIKSEVQEAPEVKPKRRATKAGTSAAKKPKLEAETSKSPTRTDDLTCRICDREYSKLFNLKRHLQLNHGREADLSRKSLCDSCGKTFLNRDSLAKHLAKGCPKSLVRVCIKCNVDFATKSAMCRHMNTLHWSEVKLRCPLCCDQFDNHEMYDHHLYSEHQIELDFNEKFFDSLEDLTKWQRNIENKDGVHFLKRCSQNGAWDYHCFPVDMLSGHRSDNLKACPARIEVVKKYGAYIVVYQSKHVCIKNPERKRSRLFCPLCSTGIEKFGNMYAHLSAVHGIEIEDKKLSFDSYNGADGGTKKKRKTKKKKKYSKDSATPERQEHRVNLTTILQHSNATPFRDKTQRGFSCLYCAKHFKRIDELRAHTAQQTEKDKINSMIDYKLSYNPIKVDITDLQCKICQMEIQDLNELKEHLVEEHGKTIHKGIKDIILPFELRDGTNFTCVVCSVVHISFKNLYLHMSSHYRNYCCDKCGAGYITIAALRKHGKTHVQGNFPCDYCDKTYTSFTKKRNHEKGVHTGGWLRNKCPHCPEIFVSYYDRSEHLVKVHNETPIMHPCNACSKVYKKKYELSRHIKHHHLQLKNFMCDSCNATFFSKRGLIDHMVKHMGGEIWTCDVCGKTFSRQRTMKEHLRSHDEDKKFQCEICNKTFLQKCSLKSHVKLHQDDLDIFKEFDDVKHLVDNRDLTLKQIAAENKSRGETILYDPKIEDQKIEIRIKEIQ